MNRLLSHFKGNLRLSNVYLSSSFCTYSGIMSGSGLEAIMFDRMPDRDQKEPMYPDYQIEFFSHAQDDKFIDNGLPINHNQSVRH